ncbi:Smr/MutS family protein [Oleidesulfovibrio alaskensis]|uniref:Smr/MutS family protein n=1 Tax=Oleidesulfovibrio alaskensis TaxID=58180 RepID=UPI001A4FBC77|nr:Smr/MutS family protein [Oleidesulfovibrio alaskensis]MBL3581180.1 Smr/MutS family protein [Oleidesulfovibrio alaskensis]
MTDTFNNPFAEIDNNEFPEAEREDQTAGTAPDEELDDAGLFAQALQGLERPAKDRNQAPQQGRRTAEQSSGGMLLGEHEAFRRVQNRTPRSGTQERKDKVQQKSRAAVTRRAAQPVSTPDDDALFGQAMTGVAPLTSRGREVNPEAALNAKTTLSSDPRASLQEFMEGKVQFQIEYTDEFIQAHVQGLDPVVMSKMRAGHYSPEGHLDLHGQNIIQSYSAMVQFIQTSYTKGKRCVLLIPGRGKNSPEGYGVLRDKVQTWLTRDPFKRVVLAFCTAQPKDGGAGALYVLLRKFKKSSGKIHWNRTPSDADLFL